jgi:hypothetical protein
MSYIFLCVMILTTMKGTHWSLLGKIYHNDNDKNNRPKSKSNEKFMWA